MKLTKVLLASFVLPLAIVGAGGFIARWMFSPTTPREDALSVFPLRHFTERPRNWHEKPTPPATPPAWKSGRTGTERNEHEH